MQYIMITLGHNASAAVVTEDGKIHAYEQERFDRKKASSAFPYDALLKLTEDGLIEREREAEVYISHWFDTFSEKTIYESKYFSLEKLNEIVNNYKLIVVDEKHTHHDAHAYSAVAFAGSHNYDGASADTTVLVADGFGNKQEVVSVYKIDHFGKPRKIHRTYGYEHSLGLMYQYATSFCGMSENKDEYKFLGYESKIKEVLQPDVIASFQRDLIGFAETMTEAMLAWEDTKEGIPEYMGGTSEFDLINFDHLKNVKESWHQRFRNWLTYLGQCGVPFTLLDDEEFKRVVIGFGVQAVIEEVTTLLVKHFEIKNLITCGGIFYNVKLNNRLLNEIDGLYCTNPINGDQGCGIGMFSAYNPFHPLDFSGMIFGQSDLPEFEDLQSEVDNGLVFETVNEEFHKNVVFGKQSDRGIIDALADLLEEGKIVNLKLPGQEFGPRALCSTSTLAKPTKRNSEAINKMNDRNEVMPMAPVMTHEFLFEHYNFDEIQKVCASDEYMIVTYHLKNMEMKDELAGVLHRDPLDDYKLTSRPQLVSGNFVHEILELLEKPILINTSYNYHGEPIILTIENALTTFNRQCERAKEAGLELPYIFILSN